MRWWQPWAPGTVGSWYPDSPEGAEEAEATGEEKASLAGGSPKAAGRHQCPVRITPEALACYFSPCGSEPAPRFMTSSKGFPLGTVVKKLPAKQEVQEIQFDSWVRTILWRRKWQLTPVFLPGKSHGQRSLTGYSLWGRQESDMTEQVTLRLIQTPLYPSPLYDQARKGVVGVKINHENSCCRWGSLRRQLGMS